MEKIKFRVKTIFFSAVQGNRGNRAHHTSTQQKYVTCVDLNSVVRSVRYPTVLVLLMPNGAAVATVL